MNKERILKSLFPFITCFMVWIAFEGFLPRISPAQSGISTLTSEDLASILPDAKGQEFSGGVLLDNFEYDIHFQPHGCIIGAKIPGGWTSEYVCSYGLYGLYKISVATTDDPETESRVLDTLVSNSSIISIPGYSNYTFTMTKKAAYLGRNGVLHGSIPGDYKFMNVKIKLPQDETKADTFRFDVEVKTSRGGYARVILIPQTQGGDGEQYNMLNTVEEDFEAISVDRADPSMIEVYLAPQMSDGRWHLVELDLDEVIKRYSALDEELAQILSVTIAGNQYKLDDIVFSQSPLTIRDKHAPYLFKIGPVYQPLFQPKERFIFAEDRDLNIFLEKDDDGNIYFPHIKDDAGRDDRNPEFDLSTARIYQEDGRPQGPDEVNLHFYLTVGTGNESDPPCNFILPITTDPNNIPVLQIPRLETHRSLWVTNKDLHDGTLRARTVHNKMYVLAHALKNSGYDVWPNVIRMMIRETGQLFEDMVFTCIVSDGLYSFKETFPVSVVNYPVTNLPPMIEDVKDLHVEVGKRATYHITAYDPDEEDTLGLTLRCAIYSPWGPPFILPGDNLTLSFIPPIEFQSTCMITITDPRGMYAVEEFTIFCVNPDPLLINYPPVIVREVDSPQRVRAGRLFMTYFRVIDPDGDPLYYYCNIGSIFKESVYYLLTYFPGTYQITITAYDSRGVSVSQEFILEVLPWWSMD